jgi:transcriptional regulator with XRE-family HTH domain
MTRTRLQLDADRHAEGLRRTLAEDLRRLRGDAGVSQAAVAGRAGVHPSLVSRVEASALDPTLETYARIAAALGADLAARVYPQSGPSIRDRHQARMADLLLASLHPRWQGAPEVAVRRPVRGWIDLVLHDPSAHALVATELESGLRRIEQLIRWSTEKAHAIASSSTWPAWLGTGPEPDVSRLLVVRWTRANRDAASAARRVLAEAYPADPRDALDALTGTAAWPGPALVWARIDGGEARLLDGWAWR